MTINYVVDTCIINELTDGNLNINQLPPNSLFYASHIQIDELKNTKNEKRRAYLLLKFVEISPKIIPTETGIWGRSRWGQAKYSNGVLYNNLRTALDAKNNAKPNNINDALIAETAIVNKHTLLTSDRDLSEVAKNFGCKVVYFERKQCP